MDRPEVVKDEHLTFLDGLRETQTVNMFGAGPYLEREFGIHRHDTKDVILYWAASFNERHKEHS